MTSRWGRGLLLYLDGEDARQDGAGDADGAAVGQELEEGVGPEEQLRDDEVRPGVHLLLQVAEVLLVALRLRVAGGVTCRWRSLTEAPGGLTPGGAQRTSNADVKVVLELRADVLHQVGGVVEAFLLFLPVGSHRVCGGVRGPE